MEEEHTPPRPIVLELFLSTVKAVNNLTLDLRNEGLVPRDSGVLAQFDEITRRLERITFESLAAEERRLDALKAAAAAEAARLIPATCPACGRTFEAEVPIRPPTTMQRSQ